MYGVYLFFRNRLRYHSFVSFEFLIFQLLNFLKFLIFDGYDYGLRKKRRNADLHFQWHWHLVAAGQS